MMWLVVLVVTSCFFYAKEARAASANGFTYTVAAGSATVTGCEGTCPGNLVIPAVLAGHPVVEIGDEAFRNKGLNSVSLPDSLIIIGDSSFISNNLTAITIPDAVEIIKGSAFSGNEIDTPVIIPDSVTQIIYSAFRDNHIPSVSIGNSVQQIGQYAFMDNEITTLTLGSSVEQIHEGAFRRNPITSLVIPNSVISIGEVAFEYCNLSQLTLGTSLVSIGKGAFAYNQLSSIALPSSVQQVEAVAFHNNKISSLDIPGSVKTIGYNAFSGNLISSLTLGNGIETIGHTAFVHNQLTTLQIPSSVQQIGDGAFSTNLLRSVSFLGDAPGAGSAVFAWNPLLTHVRRPKAATGWANSWGGMAVEYKDPQSITFGALSGRTVLAAPATLAASATSGLTVSFTSETTEVCTVSGTTLAIADIGTCTVTATQSGDSVYLAALPVSRSFVITRVLLTNKTVRFTEPDGTTPIVGATVTWSSRDGAYQSTSAATTNSSGNIVFKSIPGGTIDFAVNGIVIGAWSGYQEVSGFVGSAASTVRLAGNSYSYFTSTFTVQMPDGSPVAGAAVVLWRGHVSGSLEARFCRPFGRVEWVLRDCKSQGVTDASGRVTFRIIPTTLNTDCCGEGKRTWAQVAISDTSISYTTEAEVFDNVATAVIEIEQLPVVDMLAVDALVGYAAPRTITAVARDSNGDPMAGQALTLSASVSGASASCSGKKTTATTGSTGVATFKVCPVKTAVWSVDGASIVGSSGVTLTVQSTPTAPRSLTSTGKTRAVALTWTAPASVNIGTVTDYIVQYRVRGSSTWITFRDGTSTLRRATVTGLIKGRVYEFRIAAKNKAGTGTWSEIRSGTAR